MLWLPSHLVQVQVPHAGIKFARRYISVTPGWSDLFEKTPTWDDCLSRIRSYPVDQALFHLSQVNIALHQHPGIEGQVGLCNSLFPSRSADLRNRLVEFARRPIFHDAERLPTLFHEAQVLNAAKLALTYQSLDYSEAQESPEGLGEALLMLNDLMSANRGRTLAATEADLIASSLFNFSDRVVHGLARAYELYLRNWPDIARKHGMSLPEKLKEATGLDSDVLWTLISALWAHFENVAPDQVGQPFVPDQYLSPFTEQERAQLMRLVSCSAAELSERLHSCFSTDQVRPYNVMEFATWPLVTFGEKALCMSVNLLQKKLITGLHYLFLDYVSEKKERDLYLTVRGEVVGEYVDRLLRRAFPRMSGIYVPPDQLQRRDGGRICDGALFYGDAIVFLEVKAKQFDLPARTGVREKLDQKFEDIFYDGAEQLDETEKAFRSGVLIVPGVQPQRVRTVFPVMILLEHFVLTPLTYETIIKEFRNRKLLSATGAMPVQIMNIAELERIETGIDAGIFGFTDLLRAKIGSDEWRGVCFKNYLLAQYSEFFDKNDNRYLRQVFDQLMARTKAILSDRGIS